MFEGFTNLLPKTKVAGLQQFGLKSWSETETQNTLRESMGIWKIFVARICVVKFKFVVDCDCQNGWKTSNKHTKKNNTYSIAKKTSSVEQRITLNNFLRKSKYMECSQSVDQHTQEWAIPESRKSNNCMNDVPIFPLISNNAWWSFISVAVSVPPMLTCSPWTDVLV